jgi:murein DD-endopeptidase MepM/ murein hydrolase activator NlpD
MAITQRTRWFSNILIISVIVICVWFLVGCSTPNNSSSEFVGGTQTPIVTPQVINTEIKEEIEDPTQDESQLTTPPPVIKNNLEVIPATQTPSNPDLFVPIFDYPALEGDNRAIEPSYRFGSTLFGERIPHDGVDVLNPLGTPVLAVADGTVYFRGNDRSKKWGRYTNLYGNFIILEHKFENSNQTIFTLYAHLSEMLVEEGQPIKKGEIIGKVGATGKAFTNHLHFEVRVGDILLQNARNPELFLPLNKETDKEVGILIGSLLSINGNPVPGGTIVIQKVLDSIPDLGSSLYVETYAKGISGDENWQENFVVSDLPVGEYRITTYAYQYLIEEFITIKANEVTFIKLQPDQ